MRDMEPHNGINAKSDNSSLYTESWALSAHRWEVGEEEIIWAHGCLGPQEVWAFYKMATGSQMLSAHFKGGNLTQIPLICFH